MAYTALRTAHERLSCEGATPLVAGGRCVLRQGRLAVPNPPAHPGISEALQHLSRTDRILAELIACVGMCKIRACEDPWEALFLAISNQQISAVSAKRINEAIKHRFGGRPPSVRALLSLPFGSLGRQGLTSRKEATLRGLAQQVESGELNLTSLTGLADDLVVDRLTSFPGVGPWTACMFLLFHLGRPDVFFPDDLGIRRAIRLHYAWSSTPTKREVLELSASWSPFRSTASWYLWKSLRGFPEPGLG
jgi:DNA-3-methyladenine glycosylase II